MDLIILHEYIRSLIPNRNEVITLGRQSLTFAMSKYLSRDWIGDTITDNLNALIKRQIDGMYQGKSELVKLFNKDFPVLVASRRAQIIQVVEYPSVAKPTSELIVEISDGYGCIKAQILNSAIPEEDAERVQMYSKLKGTLINIGKLQVILREGSRNGLKVYKYRLI